MSEQSPLPEQQIVQFESLRQGTYLLRRAPNPESPLILLVHGFQSSNERMWRRFVDRLPTHCHLLAPNGPFPLPVRKESSWNVGYAWYFYDNFKDRFLVNFEIPSEFLKNMLATLGFAQNKKIIIGYSQGAYLSPYLGEALENVDHIVGINGRFKIQDPRWPEGLLIEGIHGEDDDVVEWSGAQESWSQLPQAFKGRLLGMPGVNHKPSAEMLDTVAQWVKERLSQSS